MKQLSFLSRMATTTAGAVLIWSATAMPGLAQECGDDEPFGECRVLIEINSTDGDIGFHWLTDGDDLNSTRIDDPNGLKVFENGGFGPLREQKLTESFGESAEPPCWYDSEDLEADPDEVATLRDFRDIWEPGTYQVSGKLDEGEKAFGEAELTYYLPAAPTDLDFDEDTGEISWKGGNDLGNCTPGDGDSLAQLVADGVLDVLPEDVPVLAWEVVLEPDVDDTDPRAGLVFRARVAGPLDEGEVGDDYSVTVPSEFLDTLGADTPVKIEVGAIGGDFEIDEGEVDGDDDNATFTEADDFCVNCDE